MFRAPTKKQLATDLATGFSGHTEGLFLTISTVVAAEWAQIRNTGVFVFGTVKALRASDGIITDPDAAFSAHLFVVQPDAIQTFFNNSTVNFVPATSIDFHDNFLR